MISLNREFRARLSELPAHEQKSRLRAAWNDVQVRRRQGFFIIGGFIVVMGLLVVQAAGLIPFRFNMIVVWFGYLTITGFFAQREAARHLCTALVRDRPEICGGCGYLARHADPCPECGTPRDP